MATGRISNETRRTILEMAAAGESAEDIAQSLGRNLASVNRIIEGSEGGGGKAGKKSGRRKGGSKSAPAPAPTPAPAAPRARRATGGTLTHHFWLRPGLEINLELPADLSSDEAQRLASVIQSLPFHN